MRIILSPAKKMISEVEAMSWDGLPVFLEKTAQIMRWMQGLSYDEAKRLWACNDKIALENYDRFKCMDLKKHLVPAVLSYEGIAYQYMAPAVFEDGQFEYLQEHLRILSGFYGVLKPMDGVTPYRLEMQAKAHIGGTKNLYEFWEDSLYREVSDGSHIIINLASKEYSKCIEKYLTGDDLYITCVFGELIKGKVVQKGVYAKMARGEMVRYMAENKIEDPEDLKAFRGHGYRFSKEFSTDTYFVYIKEDLKKKMIDEDIYREEV